MDSEERRPSTLKRREPDFLKGEILLIDKPQGWTSFDVVNKIRHKIKRYLGVKKIKVGHAGTLDPNATGLLILCTGKFTKKLHEFQGLGKGYTGTILLGATTPSYDSETEIVETFPTDDITEEAITAAVQQLTGPIKQVPPMFSAIKVNGQPLYKKARKGIVEEIEPRDVTIHEFRLDKVEVPNVEFYVHCSKGTYIRSLAYDLGRLLDNGAHLTALRRTSIGEYSIDDAWNLEEFIAFVEDLEAKKEDQP